MNQDQKKQPQTPHIAFLCSPGTGHLIPAVAVINRLSNFNLKITLITYPSSNLQQNSIINSLQTNINFVTLPSTPLQKIPTNTKPHVKILLTVFHSLPNLRDVLKSLSSSENSPLVALVVDLFTASALDVAKEFGIEPYMFLANSCFGLALAFYTPTLDETTEGEYAEMIEPVRVPGCVPIRGPDLPDTYFNRGGEAYKGFLSTMKKFREAKEILVNSFEGMKSGAVEWMRAETGLPQVYPVGPLILATGSASAGLKWLDEQPAGSVVYVSFGSGGALTCEQTKELAFGLEMSGQRFLWVVKSPHESESGASYFGGNQNGSSPLDFLPDGFLDLTKSFGLVVENWAPQMEVLSHRATGGFLTHCGWNSILESIVNGVPMIAWPLYANSILESIVNGVPMIAWPLYAEQKMNAMLLAEHLKVAMRVGARQCGVVAREEIARLVRCVIEGEEGMGLRRRVVELKETARVAVGDGGSSFKALLKVSKEWEMLKGTQLISKWFEL